MLVGLSLEISATLVSVSDISVPDLIPFSVVECDRITFGRRLGVSDLNLLSPNKTILPQAK